MAIEDYFHDITVLQQIPTTNSQVGGVSKNWCKVYTLSGVINQRYANNSPDGGRQGENSEYIGYFEFSYDNENYLKKSNGIRLQDENGYIYKLKGKLKNTIKRNHHFRIDLQYVDYLETVT